MPECAAKLAVADRFESDLFLLADGLADFIVLDANPLESISNTRKINKVFLRGAEVDRAAMRAKWKSQFK